MHIFNISVTYLQSVEKTQWTRIVWWLSMVQIQTKSDKSYQSYRAKTLNVDGMTEFRNDRHAELSITPKTPFCRGYNDLF